MSESFLTYNGHMLKIGDSSPSLLVIEKNSPPIENRIADIYYDITSDTETVKYGDVHLYSANISETLSSSSITYSKNIRCAKQIIIHKNIKSGSQRTASFNGVQSINLTFVNPISQISIQPYITNIPLIEKNSSASLPDGVTPPIKLEINGKMVSAILTEFTLYSSSISIYIQINDLDVTGRLSFEGLMS